MASRNAHTTREAPPGTHAGTRGAKAGKRKAKAAERRTKPPVRGERRRKAATNGRTSGTATATLGATSETVDSAWLEPQLATLVERPPRGPGWVHEIKIDGYRILAQREGEVVRLSSRRGRDWTEKFPTIAAAVAALPVTSALIDGEVAAVLPDGRTSFQALQGALSRGSDARLYYFAFDLLYLDGRELVSAPLAERKAALETLLAGRPEGSKVRLCDHLEEDGVQVLQHACRLGLEGVVSKRADAPYRSGRNLDWQKSKCTTRQEVVIGGFTDPEAGRVGLGALLCGVHDAQGELHYAGRVGTGFTASVLRTLRRRLGAIERKTSPFTERVSGRRGVPVHWVKPVLVAEVEFTEWTEGGQMRHPSFQGLRGDKLASQVVREVPVAAEKARRRGVSPRRRAAQER
ncbi:non-homologous end-joining DNA ligase [Chondromyces crocatus]|uniref:DNA ligase (ATP) n=1 Tax=Chondromyces crocatus TaxID=52 RepID=A0A0K1EK48_CHOCO|nr:non-homologous end-joining DNA ligase [Chondromyces crocatus]AKT40973.1 DNA polymerase LigD, ligase [Chondromyces crocatus]